MEIETPKGEEEKEMKEERKHLIKAQDILNARQLGKRTLPKNVGKRTENASKGHGQGTRLISRKY